MNTVLQHITSVQFHAWKSEAVRRGHSDQLILAHCALSAYNLSANVAQYKR